MKISTQTCLLLLLLSLWGNAALATVDSIAPPPATAAKSSPSKPSTFKASGSKRHRSHSAKKIGAAGSSAPLTALTPHIDTGLSSADPKPKADSEVQKVLKYGAQKHAQGNYVEAEAAFRHVISRDPKNVDAFYDLGAVAERKGDLIGALSNYRAALALKPQDKQIAEAVSSIEKNLRDRPAFTFRESSINQVNSVMPQIAPAVRSPFVMPEGGQANANLSNQNFSTPNFSAPNYAPVAGAIADPSLIPNSPVDPGAFQLSSAKNGLAAPTVGVGVAPSVALPPNPPVVGAAPHNHPVASQMLNSAASIGLRAAGLHCPACHLFRFNF